jgi:hypothetical protein
MGDTEDILRQGGDREPGRWPGRLVAVAVAAVILAVVALHLPHGRPAPVPHRSPVSTAGAAGRAPLPVPGSAVPGLPGQPNGVVGPFAPWAGSLRLLVTGQRPAWFWPATGRVQPIGGLPPDRAGYVFTRSGSGWAVQPDAAVQPGCGSCAGPSLPVYYLADHAPAVTKVGSADRVAPGATSGALWLTSYPRGADLGTTAGTADEISVAGPPLGPRLRIPAGYAIDRATDRGLLLAPVIRPGGQTAYELWDPAAAKVSRVFGGVLAASSTEIAWLPRCVQRCRLEILNLAAGRQTAVQLPPGSSVANGAFSTDGDYLALQVTLGSGSDDGALAMQLEVAAVASGHLTVVPGTWASSDALVGFGWPDGSDRLVAELTFTTKVQLASWRPGAARLAVAALRRDQNPTALVVG